MAKRDHKPTPASIAEAQAVIEQMMGYFDADIPRVQPAHHEYMQTGC